MRAKLLLAVVFWTFRVATPFAAQQTVGTITVRIQDPQGAMIARAKVSLFTRDNRVRLSVRTDESGAYRFGHLAAGKYLINAEAPGFSCAATQSVTLSAGHAVLLDVSLELAAIQEEVVVTASSTAQTVDEVSKAVSVVDRKDFEARNEFSISEAIRVVPGVRVQQLGGPGAFTAIKIRGLRTEDTAILLDGFRLRDAAAPQGDASSFLEGLVATDLDRVEILRGSGSSLYGSNAVGGVVNIVTAEGGGRHRGNLLLEGGSLDFFRGRAQLAGGFREDAITYSAGITRLSTGAGVHGDDVARNTSIQGQMQLRLTEASTVTARIYAADAFLGLTESPQAVGALPPSGIIDAQALSPGELELYEDGVPISDLDLGAANFIPSANDPDNTRNTQFVSVAVTFEKRASETFAYSFAYHGLISDRTFEDGPRGVLFEPTRDTRSDFDGRLHTFYARADLELGANNFVTAGYELEKETFLNFSLPADPAENSSVDVSQFSNTFFIQDQLALLGGALQLSGAFRAQFFSLNEPSFTPAVAAPYQGLDFESSPNAYTGDGSVAYFFRDLGTKLRAHVGNGYRAPSLFERFGTFFSLLGYSVFGDPRLGPERSLGFDTGIDQDFADGRARVSGTYFYTRLQEVILFDFSGAINPGIDPFGRFGGYRLVDGGVAQGLELSLTARPLPSFHLATSYTYTDAEPPTGPTGELLQAFVIPEHEFSVVATQSIGSDFYINFDLTASSDYLAPVFDPGTFTNRVFNFGGIVKADLGASYTLSLSPARGLRFFGKVDNLFDQAYFENGFRTAGRMGVGGVAFEF